MEKIGSYQAKTNLPQFLRRVIRGESFVITLHGKDVARLIPMEAEEGAKDLTELVKKSRVTRKKVSLKGLSLRSLISEGRM